MIFERLLGQGYAGGLTTVKTYIAAHRDLVPAKRRQAAPQGCRGQRFRTAPGEAYQMDWGFVAIERPGGERARIACFAMVCHHCGSAHVEFFPNARQENLLIGMLHAFSALGVPATVLTDNMKSVVVRRDVDGRPVWQADYAEFMGVVGFRTRLCRPRHPYTKDKVERLVRFVKGNFLAGRSFTDLRPRGDDARRGRRPGGQDHQPAHTVVGVPYVKGLADFDWDFQPSVPRAEIEELATLRFVERAENVLLVGSPGVGKTHLAVALGIEAVRAGREVRFVDCARLVEDLEDASSRGILKKRLKYYAHSRLLIIDELGYLDVGSAGADLLFQLISTRYEQRSTIITTNVGISGWGRVFGDDVAASAIADRVCHHCHLVKITGRSYRLKDLPRDGPVKP